MRGPALVTTLMLAATQGALGAATIPSSELPGRERYRFVDPPGSTLMQPTQPNVQFPYNSDPVAGPCTLHVTRTSRWKRLKRRGC